MEIQIVLTVDGIKYASRKVVAGNIEALTEVAKAELDTIQRQYEQTQ